MQSAQKPSMKLSKMNGKNVPKHQIILDKALEGQFDQTLELFDVFVGSMASVDPRKFRVAEYQQNLSQEPGRQPESGEKKEELKPEGS